MPISNKPWFAQSASECTASASMDPEPVTRAATSLATKMAKFAPSLKVYVHHGADRNVSVESGRSPLEVALEECDVVTARLVDAVLGRRSAETTAQMTTVTATESKPFAKKPGERFWFVGLPVGLYNSGQTPAGFSLGYGYEAENFRMSVSGAAYARGSDGIGYVVMEGAWIPFATEFSPFIGAGLGYMGAGGHGGLGGLVEGGIEAFRLHGVRALAGVQVTIPFFDTTESSAPLVAQRTVYPAAFVRLAF